MEQDNLSFNNSNQLNQPAPKKSKNPLLVPLILVSVLALAGIGFGVFEILAQKLPKSSVSSENENPEVAKDNAPEKDELEVKSSNKETEVKEVKEIVGKIYEKLADELGARNFYQIFGNGSFILLPDSDLYTLSEESYGVSSTIASLDSDFERQTMDNASDYVEEVLTANDYAFVEEVGLGGNKLFYNSDKKIYCLSDQDTFPFDVDCANVNWISNEKKELVLTLAKVADVNYVNAKVANIENSPVSPYQRLTASSWNYAMLFYRPSPDSDWVYITGTQDLVSCDIYDEEAKKAYAGEKCWDTEKNQESTL